MIEKKSASDVVKAAFEKRFTTIHLDSDTLDDVEISQGLAAAILACGVGFYAVNRAYKLLAWFLELPSEIADAIKEGVYDVATSVKDQIDPISNEAIGALGRTVTAASSYPTTPAWLEGTSLGNMLAKKPWRDGIEKLRAKWFDDQGIPLSSYAGISDVIKAELDSGNFSWFTDGRPNNWVGEAAEP